VNDISVTAGGNTLTASVTVTNTPAAARSVTVTPATATIKTSDIGVVRVKVTDVFGNPVPGVAATATSNLGASLAGVGLLNGFNVSIPTLTATDASGETAFTYVSNTAGTGTITVAGTDTTPGSGNSQFGAGNGAGLINGAAVTGAPAGTPTGTAVFTVTDTAGSITITGSRDNRAIKVDGTTTGIADGTVVKPWLRFPGQTGFSEGAAQRSVTNGAFSWGRNTGKRVAVEIRTLDGLRSNAVTIAAR
jgi:hypothetical protein